MLLLQLPCKLNPLGTGGRHHNENLTWRKSKRKLLIIKEFSFSFASGTFSITLNTVCISVGFLP